MAIVLVNAVSVYDGTTRAITKSVTSGDFIIFFYQYSGLGNCAIPTDTQFNVWALIVERSGSFSANIYSHLYWTRATATGSLTVTGAVVAGATDYGESLHEYTGADTSGTPLGVTNTAIATGSGDGGPAQVTLTGVVANALIIAGAGDETGSSTYTALTDYTRETNEPAHQHATLDRVLSGGAGDYTPGFTLGASRGWVIVAGSIKSVAGGGPAALVTHKMLLGVGL